MNKRLADSWEFVHMPLVRELPDDLRDAVARETAGGEPLTRAEEDALISLWERHRNAAREADEYFRLLGGGGGEPATDGQAGV